MGRIITLIYGACSYAAFFLTFLYAIGFLGNVLVPKTVTPSRLRENLETDFALDEDAMAAIAALDTGHRWGPDPDTFDYG